MGRVLVECINAEGFAARVTPFASNVSRTWVLNDVGTATFSFAAGVPFLPQIIEWGTVYVIREVGIQPWIGICEDRSWEQGAVTLNLKSAEQLMGKHLTRQGITIPAGTPAGMAAQTLFRSAIGNDVGSLLKVGVMDATAPHFLEFDYADLLDAFKGMTENYNGYWWVDENLNVNFRNERGQDLSSTVKLFEGKNLTSVKFTESIGDALTNVVMLGANQGDGTDVTTKYKKTLRIPGLPYHRAEVITVDSATTAEALVAPATAALQLRSVPKLTIDCTVVKSGDTWGQFFIGDTISCMLYSKYAPTEVRCRVTGMELGETDEFRCILEVVPDKANVTPIEWLLQ